MLKNQNLKIKKNPKILKLSFIYLMLQYFLFYKSKKYNKHKNFNLIKLYKNLI